MRYTREMILRDITYYLHECAEWQSIAFDLDYIDLLAGPYWQFVNDSDPLIREGSMLIIVGMLEDWNAGSGFAFGDYNGKHPHNLETVLSTIIAGYTSTNTSSAPRMHRLFAYALTVLDNIDRWNPIERKVPTRSPELLGQFRMLLAERRADLANALGESPEASIFHDYVLPYFVNRCQGPLDDTTP